MKRLHACVLLVTCALSTACGAGNKGDDDDNVDPLPDILYYPDPPDDGVGSVEGEQVTYWASPIDLVQAEVGRVLAAFPARKTRLVPSCGATGADGSIVICPTGVQPFPEGELFAFTTTVAGPLPAAGADDGHHFIYGLVLDSDGEPANDWRYIEPYDWDYFQATDRWYELIWSPTTTSWSLTVRQVDEDPFQSGALRARPASSSARAEVLDDKITWYVSAAELPAERPRFRVTAFGHDGAFSPSDRGGDVLGANPTEPLVDVPEPLTP